MSKPLKQIVLITATPVKHMVGVIHAYIPHNHKHSKHVVAASFFLVGPYLAQHPMAGVPHFLWDGFAYAIHGFGCAPLIESLAPKLGFSLHPEEPHKINKSHLVVVVHRF
jgi:hypothetical protein